jgi:serine/threonine-protein kinase
VALTRASWKRLEPWVDQALELTPAARQKWLSELTVGSPELVAELTALFESSAVEEAPPLLGQLPESSLVGMELGSYRVEKALGQGGMGSVWLGRRCDGRFDGVAAIKLLHLSAMDTAGLARFKREAWALARLTHSGIARLLDAGVSHGGQPFLVLEYIDGEPIDAYADTRHLARGERLQLFLQVVAAVQHAHAHLIVHRDIKPSNILVTPDGRAKLLDFGIAKLLGDSDAERATITRDRGPFTPLYAAPEQVLGDVLTTATDVYALGVLLYVLLSGRHPTTHGVTNQAACLRAVLEVEPPQLGAGDLDNILAKALCKAPAGRYGTVGALTDDVERYLRREPVSAHAPSFWYRTARFVSRHRLGVGAGSATLAGLVAAMLISIVNMREAVRQRDIAVRESRRADAQVEFQNLMLASAGERPMTMREVLDAGRTLVEQQRADDDGVLGRLLLQLAAGYSQLYELDARQTLLERAQGLALAGGDKDLLTEVRCEIAASLRLQGRYSEAWRAQDGAMALLTPETNPRQSALCFMTRATLANETGRLSEALPSAQKAVQLLEQDRRTNTWLYYQAREEFAESLKTAGRPREGVAAYRQTIALLETAGLGQSAHRSSMEHNLAIALTWLGEMQEAERLFRRYVEREQTASGNGRLNWQSLVHYAETVLVQGNVPAALQHFGLLVDQALADHNDYWEARGLYGLGRAAVSAGQLAEAERYAARLKDLIAQDTHVLDTDDVVPSAEVLEGLVARARGDLAMALARFTAALDGGGFHRGRSQRRWRPVVVLAAETALELGNLEEAVQLARAAEQVALVDPLAESRSAFVGEARATLGRILLAQGDRAGAAVLLQKSQTALQNGAGAEHPVTRQVQRLLRELGISSAGAPRDAGSSQAVH